MSDSVLKNNNWNLKNASFPKKSPKFCRCGSPSHENHPGVFFPEPCHSYDIFSTIATTCGFMFSELRTSHLKSHRWEHCPLSGFVSDQIFAAPGFSGLHRKKASACTGATVTDQLVPCDLGLSAGWTRNLVWVLLMEQKVLRKAAESIVYSRFKYVYCKNIQLIISISFNICDEYQNSQLFNISWGMQQEHNSSILRRKTQRPWPKRRPTSVISPQQKPCRNCTFRRGKGAICFSYLWPGASITWAWKIPKKNYSGSPN